MMPVAAKLCTISHAPRATPPAAGQSYPAEQLREQVSRVPVRPPLSGAADRRTSTDDGEKGHQREGDHHHADRSICGRNEALVDAERAFLLRFAAGGRLCERGPRWLMRERAPPGAGAQAIVADPRLCLCRHVSKPSGDLPPFLLALSFAARVNAGQTGPHQPHPGAMPRAASRHDPLPPETALAPWRPIVAQAGPRAAGERSLMSPGRDPPNARSRSPKALGREPTPGRSRSLSCRAARQTTTWGARRQASDPDRPGRRGGSRHRRRQRSRTASAAAQAICWACCPRAEQRSRLGEIAANRSGRYRPPAANERLRDAGSSLPPPLGKNRPACLSSLCRWTTARCPYWTARQPALDPFVALVFAAAEQPAPPSFWACALVAACAGETPAALVLTGLGTPGEERPNEPPPTPRLPSRQASVPHGPAKTASRRYPHRRGRDTNGTNCSRIPGVCRCYHPYAMGAV